MRFLSILAICCLLFQANAQQSCPLVKRWLSQKKFDRLFPHKDTLYSYTAFLAACSRFPSFANEGTDIQNKRELLAFLANIAHETTDGWPEAEGGPYVWGLVYKEEQACIKKPCPIYNTGGTSKYKPLPGKNYFGRGPLQLSYAYNYGLAGDDLQLPLLEHPEWVCHNGEVAFSAALWFWMKAQTPKPSCHDVMCGKWKPTANDSVLNRKPGFGMTINIINGGLECNTQKKEVSYNRNERIGFYKHFCTIMKVQPELDCDCVKMVSY